VLDAVVHFFRCVRRRFHKIAASTCLLLESHPSFPGPFFFLFFSSPRSAFLELDRL